LNNYKISELPGGIKLVSETIPYIKSFSIGFWFNVGARDENESNNGISHFIEHMVFKGTTKRSAKKISEDIEAYGGYLNAFTGKENTCFYGRGLEKNLDRTFNVISDMIQNPLFKQIHIKKESGVVIDELLDINDNPEELIFDKFEEVLFAGNNLSMPIIGTEKNLRSFNSSSLHKFHSQNYSLDNLLIAASGALNHDELTSLTQKYFRKTKQNNSRKRRVFLKSTPSESLIEKDIQQVHSIIGRDTIGYKDERRLTLKVLSILLGEGSSSRLFQAVREKLGITYQINSFLNSYNDVSAFGVYFSTNDKQADKVVNIIFREFKKLRDKKVSQKELSRVKEYLKGSIILGLENTSNRMIRMANSIIYYNRVITVEEILNKIDLISVDDILELSNQYLCEKDFTRIFVRSTNKKMKKVA
jgi:predicted Zn-dependent peptidase